MFSDVPDWHPSAQKPAVSSSVSAVKVVPAVSAEVSKPALSIEKSVPISVMEKGSKRSFFQDPRALFETRFTRNEESAENPLKFSSRKMNL